MGCSCCAHLKRRIQTSVRLDSNIYDEQNAILKKSKVRDLAHYMRRHKSAPKKRAEQKDFYD